MTMTGDWRRPMPMTWGDSENPPRSQAANDLWAPCAESANEVDLSRCLHDIDLWRRGARVRFDKPKNLAELSQRDIDGLYLRCGVASDRYPAWRACGTSEPLTYQCNGLLSAGEERLWMPSKSWMDVAVYLRAEWGG